MSYNEIKRISKGRKSVILLLLVCSFFMFFLKRVSRAQTVVTQTNSISSVSGEWTCGHNYTYSYIFDYSILKPGVTPSPPLQGNSLYKCEPIEGKINSLGSWSGNLIDNPVCYSITNVTSYSIDFRVVNLVDCNGRSSGCYNNNTYTVCDEYYYESESGAEYCGREHQEVDTSPTACIGPPGCYQVTHNVVCDDWDEDGNCTLSHNDPDTYQAVPCDAGSGTPGDPYSGPCGGGDGACGAGACACACACACGGACGGACGCADIDFSNCGDINSCLGNGNSRDLDTEGQGKGVIAKSLDSFSSNYPADIMQCGNNQCVPYASGSYVLQSKINPSKYYGRCNLDSAGVDIRMEGPVVETVNNVVANVINRAPSVTAEFSENPSEAAPQQEVSVTCHVNDPDCASDPNHTDKTSRIKWSCVDKDGKSTSCFFGKNDIWKAGAMTENFNTGSNLDSSGIEIDSYTKLILHADGADNSTNFVDYSYAPHSVTPNGNVKISTAESKFGGASAYFDGNNSYLRVPSSSDFNFGSGDFTIDLWANFSALPGREEGMTLVGKNNSSREWLLYYHNNNNISNTLSFMFSQDGSSYSFSPNHYVWTPNLNQWYHIAVARKGSTTKMFINGQEVGSSDWNYNIFSTSNDVNIGYGEIVNGTAKPFKGYIDEPRISKGIARWTSNFTPPVGSSLGNAASTNPLEATVRFKATDLGVYAVTCEAQDNDLANPASAKGMAQIDIKESDSHEDIQYCSILHENGEKDLTVCVSSDPGSAKVNYKAYLFGIDTQKYETYQWKCKASGSNEETSVDSKECTYDYLSNFDNPPYTPSLTMVDKETMDVIPCNSTITTKLTCISKCSVEVKQSDTSGDLAKSISIPRNSEVEGRVNKQCLVGGETTWNVVNGNILSSNNNIFKALINSPSAIQSKVQANVWVDKDSDNVRDPIELTGCDEANIEIKDKMNWGH